MKRIMIILLAIFLVACNEESVIEENQTIDLEIWHIWTTDTDANRQTLEMALEDVKKAYPDVNIKIVARETETYKIRIKTSIASGSMPDIFYSWGGGFSKSFVEAGKVLNLDEFYYNNLSSCLPVEYMTNQMYNGEIYGLPFMQSYAVLFVNQAILNEYDLPLPESYENLKTISYRLKDQSVVPLVVAGADLWPFMFQYASLAQQEVGGDLVVKALNGDVSFDQEGFIEAAYKLQALQRFGTFGDDALYMGYDQAANLFKNGHAAMFYIGSWATGGFTSETQVSESIKAMKYPSSNQGHDDVMLGGTVDSFMISKNTKHPELAMDVTSMLVEKMSMYGPQRGMGLPVWNIDRFKLEQGEQSDPDYQIISQLYDDIIDLSKDANETVMWWDTYLGSKGTECNALIVKMVSGQLTPEDFVKEMDQLIQRND